MKKKQAKQKIRVFTAFSGYDSQMMAMKRLCRDYPDLLECELVGWSEIDEAAIRSHNAVFPESADKNLGDISKIDWSTVPDFDLFTYSSPCFVAGTQVRTKDGLKNIEDIKVGDEVITHTGDWHKVTDVMSHEYDGDFLVEISSSTKDTDVQYSNGLTEKAYNAILCTPNHRFYVKSAYASEPDWKEVRHLYEDDRLCEFVDGKPENALWYVPEHFELIKNEKPVTVYNLTVDVDNSYTVYDVVCHNCQDFSRAGLQKGGEKGTGTRSSLLWECERTIREKRPGYCLLENVKALYSDKKFHPLLMRWKKTVDEYGYHSYIKVINAADMDVPQGRERVFMVSIRNDIIDSVFEGKDYRFPAPMERKRKIEDFLQPADEVPEEYYLSADKLPKFLNLLAHAGDEFEETLSDEQKEAIKSAKVEMPTDQENTSRLSGIEGYIPKKKTNSLF